MNVPHRTRATPTVYAWIVIVLAVSVVLVQATAICKRSVSLEMIIVQKTCSSRRRPSVVSKTVLAMHPSTVVVKPHTVPPTTSFPAATCVGSRVEPVMIQSIVLEKHDNVQKMS